MRFLFLLLLAAPLSAQQTVVVPDVSVTVEPPAITNEINIEVMSDSAMIPNLNTNLELLREQIASQECNTCGGTSTVVRLGQGGLTLLALWMAISLSKIAGKESVHNTDVTSPDVNVDVDVHEHETSHDDDNEDSEN